MTRELRVAHVITGLGAGGAEAMLVELARGLAARGVSQHVVSLLEGGVNAERLSALGIPVHALGMSKRAPDPRLLVRLHRWLRRAAPHVVQTWMYQADVVGGLAAQGLPGVPVVWGVHSTTLPPGAALPTRAAVALSARVSDWLPTRIVVCSQTGLEHHANIGYARERMLVIENGVDTARFQPDAEARARVRRALSVSEDEVLIGLPARFAPEKDHATFFAAVQLLRRTHAHVRALLCGEGTDEQNPALDELARAHGLGREALLRLGRRDDMPELLPALDIVCLSSSHVEAFSIALCEAMAAGVPCAATNVGDSARILGRMDLIAPPRSPEVLAQVLGRLVEAGPTGRRQLGNELRQRVRDRFSLERTVHAYETLYRGLASAHGRT